VSQSLRTWRIYQDRSAIHEPLTQAHRVKNVTLSKATVRRHELTWRSLVSTTTVILNHL